MELIMKEKFVNLMADQEFEKASKLLWKEIRNISLPPNVNVNLNDSEEIKDLSEKLRNNFSEIESQYSDTEIKNYWERAFKSDLEVIKDKQYLKDNIELFENFKREVEPVFKEHKNERYAELYDQYVRIFKTTLEATVRLTLKSIQNII